MNHDQDQDLYGDFHGISTVVLLGEKNLYF